MHCSSFCLFVVVLRCSSLRMATRRTHDGPGRHKMRQFLLWSWTSGSERTYSSCCHCYCSKWLMIKIVFIPADSFRYHGEVFSQRVQDWWRSKHMASILEGVDQGINKHKHQREREIKVRLANLPCFVVCLPKERYIQAWADHEGGIGFVVFLRDVLFVDI